MKETKKIVKNSAKKLEKSESETQTQRLSQPSCSPSLVSHLAEFSKSEKQKRSKRTKRKRQKIKLKPRVKWIKQIKTRGKQADCSE